MSFLIILEKTLGKEEVSSPMENAAARLGAAGASTGAWCAEGTNRSQRDFESFSDTFPLNISFS